VIGSGLLVPIEAKSAEMFLGDFVSPWVIVDVEFVAFERGRVVKKKK